MKSASFSNAWNNSRLALPWQTLYRTPYAWLRGVLRRYASLWTDPKRSVRSAVWYVLLTAYAAAALDALLTPRTVLNAGYLPAPQWVLPLLGMALCMLVFPVANSLSADPKIFRWLPALLILTPFVPLTMQIGLGFLIAAGLLSWWRLRGVQRLAGLALGNATLWLLVLTVSNGYLHAAARIRNYSIAANALTLCLNIFGVHSAAGGGHVYLSNQSITYSVLASPDKFGGDFVLVFATGLLLLGLLHRIPWARIAGAILAVFAYSLLRTIWMLSSHIMAGSDTIWWNEAFTLLSFLPLLPILLAILTIHAANPLSLTAPKRSNRWGWLPLMAAGAFCMALGWLWVDAGHRKTGAVMIDEKYSRWEWSEHPLDMEMYGVRTVYSYYDMMEAFKQYYPVRRNFQDINDDTLKDVSVLTLKTPTAQYPPEALNAIWRFIERGGGVWFIGDHTDVFGMDSYLNSVASRYGLRFLFDAAIDPETNRQLFAPSALSHPIVRHLPLFLWYTSDSLEAPWFSNDVIVSPRLLEDSPDYSSNTFFGTFTPDLNKPIVPVIQASAIPIGRGRLALWSDSTVFSNFAIFLPGKMEIALASVDWLNRSNNPLPVRWILLIAGCLLLLIGACFTRLEIIFVAIWIGIALAIPAVNFLYNRTYPEMPLPKLAGQVAFFEPDLLGHLPIAYPPDNEEASPDSYLTAFIAAQRAGFHPFVASTFQQALSAREIVISHGHFRLTGEEVGSLRAWIVKGGRLILLDGGRGNPDLFRQLATLTNVRTIPIQASKPVIDFSKIKQMMPELPIAPTTDSPDALPIQDRDHHKLGYEQLDFSLIGGKPLIIGGSSGAVAVEADLGSGQMILTSTKALFSDLSLGENSTIPDDRQLALLRLLYSWYGKMPDSP